MCGFVAAKASRETAHSCNFQVSEYDSAMARTGTKKHREISDPEKSYAKLSYPDQMICYNYFQWDETDGTEGWDPNLAGSVYHQRSSHLLLSLGTSSWFRHRAKAMVTLAEAFKQHEKKPTKPVKPDEEAEESFTSPPQSKRRVQEESDDDEEFDSPAPIRGSLKRTTPKMPTPMRNLPSTPSAGTIVYQADLDLKSTRQLTVPMSYGIHKEWNPVAKKSVTKILIRMVLHGGCLDSDFDYEWVTPRHLLLRVKWPDWFLNAEEMCYFATQDNDDKTPLFPPEHPLTMDICERNYNRVAEDGAVWDEGSLKFAQDMVIDSAGIMQSVRLWMKRRRLGRRRNSRSLEV